VMSPWMAAAASVPLLLALHAPAAWAYSVPVAHRPVASLRRSALVRLQMPEAGAQIKSDETYRMMLSALLKTEKSVKSEISTNYAMVDYGFLQRLDELIATGGDDLPRLEEIKEACNAEMASRMQQAAEALKEVLTSPTPVIMEGKIAGLARQGRIDNAMVELLEANLQQAQAAGEAGKGAVAVMTKLQQRVQTELDAKLSPPVALLRQLLRMDDALAREALLREKMAPKKVSNIVLTTDTGAEQEPEKTTPDVPPKAVAEAIAEMKSRFGNVDENYDTGFVQRLEQIADEAETVALDLAGGKEMSSKQQQDMMWERGTVSVWDLEAVEEEAHQDGNFAMWEQEAQDQMARQDAASREQGIQRDFQ